jgi:hypothetical protein
MIKLATPLTQPVLLKLAATQLFSTYSSGRIKSQTWNAQDEEKHQEKRLRSVKILELAHAQP